jgi:ribonuclease D
VSVRTHLITEPAALSELIDQLAQAPWIAVDTEFTRIRTYYARLGLVQIATPETIACVDPLALDIDRLLDVLYAPQPVKIFHAGRQDLEVLYDRRGAVPGPLFDTQIAAALVGYPEQIAYAALAEALAGVKLPKLHTRTDWEARPLSDEQLHYAEDDVRFLGMIYDALSAELDRRGRAAWLDEECAALGDPALYANDPARAYQRIKGRHLLAPAGQARLKRLAEWRERTAKARDLPRGWVAPDNVLIDIARSGATELAALARVRGVTPALVRAHGEELLELLRTDGEPAGEKLWSDPRPPSGDEQMLLRRLQARVEEAAADAGLAPAVVGGRKAVLELMRGGRGPLARGWRHTLVGHELVGMLSGTAT